MKRLKKYYNKLLKFRCKENKPKVNRDMKNNSVNCSNCNSECCSKLKEFNCWKCDALLRRV